VSSSSGITHAPSETFADQHLGRRVAKSAAWMVLKRFFFKSVGLISTLILVRILAPDAFGLAVMGSVAFDVLDSMTEFSFALALIKMKQPERVHFDTAWTMLVARGMIVGAVMFFSAPLVAETMHEPRLLDITRALSLLPVIQGFENVGLIQFRRELQFERIFWYEVFGKLIGFVLVIPAALILHSAWALVIGYVGPKFILIPVSYFIHPYRPRFTLKAGRELLNFSKWLFATNLLYLVRDYTMVMLLGRVGGASAAGLFQQSYQIAELPASEIAAPIRQPMYSGYAKVLDDRERLGRQFVDGLSLMLMMIAPASVGIALVAGLVEPIALGPKWVGAAPLIQICAIYFLSEAFGDLTHSLYVVLDRQRRFVGIMVINITIRTALVIWAGITHGVVWAAIAMAATSFVGTAIWYGQVTHIVGDLLGITFRATWRIMVAVAIMAAGVLLVQAAWPQAGTLPVMGAQLASESLVGAVIYVGVVLGLWRACGRPPGPESHAVTAALQVWPKLRSALPLWRSASPAAE
jgi:O-antigen/teichoic acid export membrane protein